MKISIKKAVLVIPIACLVSLLKMPSSLEAQSFNKKLVEFGWDQPDPIAMKANITTMEKDPLDGVVFNPIFTVSGAYKSFADAIFVRSSLSWTALQTDLQAYQTTNFTKFFHNFLRVNLSPGDVDWYDDYAIPIANLGVAGRFLRESGARGIHFDLEDYSKRGYFNYSTRPHRSQYTFAQYAAKARERGRQAMNAMQAQNPNLVLFLSFGYSMATDDNIVLETFKYGLLRYFVDGLLEVAGPGVTVIDGYEGSYAYRTQTEYNRAYGWVYGPFRAISAVPAAFDAHYSLAFGIWMDLNSNSIGWDPNNPQRNGFTPYDLSNSILYALNRSDEYVWLYCQKAWWWDPSRNISQPYLDAIKRSLALGRAYAQKGAPTPLASSAVESINKAQKRGAAQE